MITVQKLIERCKNNANVAAYILGRSLPSEKVNDYNEAASLPLRVFQHLNSKNNQIFENFLTNSKQIYSEDKSYKYFELNLSYTSNTNKKFCIDDSNYNNYLSLNGGKSTWTSETITINGNSYHMYNQWSNLNTGYTLANFALKLYEFSKGEFFIKFKNKNEFELHKCSNLDVTDEYITDNVINSLDINELFPKSENSEKKNSDTCDNKDMKSSSTPHGRNIIFYGAPGTGKSHTVDNIIKGIKKGQEDYGLGPGIDFRTTFHPDTDYATFVGCYKPSMKNNRIEYHFTMQVFLEAYKYAWEHLGEQVYLVIEEINRGNCAQIFGDIFQLLDREPQTDGHSKYLINPDVDIISELKNQMGRDYRQSLNEVYEVSTNGNQNLAEKIKKGVLALPGNLTILATMNTSDQSLFPMDSAFKRRWEWKYIKIDYDKIKDWKLHINKQELSWKCVLKHINDYIRERKNATDKQLGEFFLMSKDSKNVIGFEEFRDKVLFYLFNDVFKGDRSFFAADNNRRFFEDIFTGSLSENDVYNWMEKNMNISECLYSKNDDLDNENKTDNPSVGDDDASQETNDVNTEEGQ